jgi:hypothetical protein
LHWRLAKILSTPHRNLFAKAGRILRIGQFMDEWNLFEAAVECFSFCQYAIAPLVVLHLFLQRMTDERHWPSAARSQLEKQVLEWLTMSRPPESVEKSDFYQWFVVNRVRCHTPTIKKVRTLHSPAAQHALVRRPTQPLGLLGVLPAS